MPPHSMMKKSALPCSSSPPPPKHLIQNKKQSLVSGDEFQHILRVLNTNVDGKNKVMYALTAIRGIGRRFSNLVCKKAEVDMRKRCVLQRLKGRLLCFGGFGKESSCGRQRRFCAFVDVMLNTTTHQTNKPTIQPRHQTTAPAS
jgi:hypothetical protein